MTTHKQSEPHLLRSTAWSAAVLFVLVAVGCADSEETTTESAPPVRVAPADDTPEIITPSELRHRLRANEKAQFRRVGNDIVEAALFESGVKSIEPLRGLPLRVIDLGRCREIDDISALEGMALQKLILEDTPVSDISVLKGMPLEVLYLQNTSVTDLSAIEGMSLRELNLMNVPVEDISFAETLPLKTLWIPGTNVSDLAPLSGKSLESLDIEGTPAADFSVLSTMTSLKRLNIAETSITDVSVLKGLKLDRLTISPERIESGMEALRDMPSLSQFWISNGIGQEPQQFSSTEFWERYDLGVWNSTSDAETPDDKQNPSSNESDTTDTDPDDSSEDQASPAENNQ